MEVEINGILYRQKETTPKSRRESAALSVLMGVYASVGMLSGGKRPYKKDMPSYNLIDEFRLIQSKQSKLSRSEREYVQNQFNRLFDSVLPISKLP